MIKDQIEIGKVYIAKVSGRLCRVRVTSITKREGYGRTKATTRYDATNLETGREITIKSAAKLRRESPEAK